MSKKIILFSILLFLIVGSIFYVDYSTRQTGGLILVMDKWEENNNYFISAYHPCSSLSDDPCSERLTIKLKGNLRYIQKENNHVIMDTMKNAEEVYDFIQPGEKYSTYYREWNLFSKRMIMKEFRIHDHL